MSVSGEILNVECLKSLGLTANALAMAIGNRNHAPPSGETFSLKDVV
jgi:hypothetical protein